MPRDHLQERRKVSTPPADAGARREPVVVPFPCRASRPTRPAPATGETRGEVLLFLGVRYESLAS